MKAWLKGGLIGLIIGFILLIPVVFVTIPPSGRSVSSIGMVGFYLTIPSVYLVYFLLIGVGIVAVISISLLLNWFLIGAIIGLIIGKIKSKKRRVK